MPPRRGEAAQEKRVIRVEGTEGPKEIQIATSAAFPALGQSKIRRRLR